MIGNVIGMDTASTDTLTNSLPSRNLVAPAVESFFHLALSNEKQ